jgi:hypothetical protein
MLCSGAAKLRCERGRSRPIRVLNRSNVKTTVLQTARHVRAHPPHSNKTNIHVLKLATDAHG